MTKWIKCSERLPALHKKVLSYSSLWHDIEVSYLSDIHSKEWMLKDDYICPEVTHWAELPKSPAQIEKEREEYANSDYCKALTKYVEHCFERYSIPIDTTTWKNETS